MPVLSGVEGLDPSGTGVWIAWGQFSVCAVVIVISGIYLTRYADRIADRTGMGKTWIGVILLASVTSLPELLTGISSVTAAGVPDIAAGDVFGSCVFNLTILAVLDLFYKKTPVLSQAGQGHILAAAFGIVMLTIAGLGLFAAGTGISLSFLWIGFYTPLNLLLYFVAMRLIFRMERRRLAAAEPVVSTEKLPTATLFRRLGWHAVVIVAAASFLPFAAKTLAEVSGLGTAFVGNLLVAMATSLPEVVTSLAALRMGAIDLALGNLLGSNLFNLAILSIDDLLYLRNPILVDVSRTHLLSVFSAILMTGIAVACLLYQPQKKLFWTVSWISVLMLSVYLLTAHGIYVLETGG